MVFGKGCVYGNVLGGHCLGETLPACELVAILLRSILGYNLGSSLNINCLVNLTVQHVGEGEDVLLELGGQFDVTCNCNLTGCIRVAVAPLNEAVLRISGCGELDLSAVKVLTVLEVHITTVSGCNIYSIIFGVGCVYGNVLGRHCLGETLPTCELVAIFHRSCLCLNLGSCLNILCIVDLTVHHVGNCKDILLKLSRKVDVSGNSNLSRIILNAITPFHETELLASGCSNRDFITFKITPFLSLKVNRTTLSGCDCNCKVL